MGIKTESFVKRTNKQQLRLICEVRLNETIAQNYEARSGTPDDFGTI